MAVVALHVPQCGDVAVVAGCGWKLEFGSDRRPHFTKAQSEVADTQEGVTNCYIPLLLAAPSPLKAASESNTPPAALRGGSLCTDSDRVKHGEGGPTYKTTWGRNRHQSKMP